MNTHIVNEPASLIRKIARDALRNHWKEMFIGIFIYTILTGYVSAILNLIFPNYQDIELYGQYITINKAFVGDIYQTVLTGAFMYGLALFMLTFFRTKRVDNKLLFEGFSMLGKTILLQIVVTVFIFLWTLLFIIPGIIAAFRYSMAFYILADHPEYTVMQCINESKARMRGNCGKYFTMLLSFIGWAFLASVAQELIVLPSGGTVGMLITNLIGLIPVVFLYVYVKTTETVFYELLTQNLVVMVPDQHVRAQGVDPDNMVNANYEIHEETDTMSGRTAQAGAAGAAAAGEKDSFAEKVSDVTDGLADVVSDATDKLADLQHIAEDKIDDFIPDAIGDKIDDISVSGDKTAEGAPDVPVQVYEAEVQETEVPAADDIVGETPDEFVREEGPAEPAEEPEDAEKTE